MRACRHAPITELSTAKQPPRGRAAFWRDASLDGHRVDLRSPIGAPVSEDASSQTGTTLLVPPLDRSGAFLEVLQNPHLAVTMVLFSGREIVTHRSRTGEYDLGRSRKSVNRCRRD
jgi:hypothetical protein